MEIFLIILGILAASILLTLLTSCLANRTLNPFEYFRLDWESKYFQVSLGFYVLVLGLIGFPIYMASVESKSHYIKAEWNKNTGYYDVIVSGSDVKGVNIIQEENKNKLFGW